MSTEKKLIIMMGVSGSGKSTYAKNYFTDAPVCSADHFMMDGGKYEFSFSKLAGAHKSCQEKVLSLMQNGENTIVVDNTNTKKADRMFYLKMAELYDYTVYLYALPFNEKVLTRNVHGVTPEKITQQLSKCDVPLGFVYIETPDKIIKIKEISPSETGIA